MAEVLGSAFSAALVQLFASHDEAVFDYLDFRRDMEALAAERAARLGSETDLQVIGAVLQKMEAANAKRDPTEEAGLDAEFQRVDDAASMTAALGGEVEVPTIDGGKSRVKVPAGSQTGKQMRLRAKGMPALRGGGAGDM